MAVVAGDIQWFFSQQGGEAYTGSLGGAIGTTQLTDDTDNNLFDDVSGAEASAGDLEYRCFYIKNNNGTDTWSAVYAWINTNTPASGDAVRIALGTSGLNGTEQTIADEDTEPVGVSWSTAINKGAGLSLGNLTAGDYYPLWVERNVSAAAGAYAGNSFIIEIEGETT